MFSNFLFDILINISSFSVKQKEMQISEKCWKPPCKYRCRYGLSGSNLVDSCGVHGRGTGRIELLNKKFKPIISSDNNEDIIFIDIGAEDFDLNDNTISSSEPINHINNKKTGCQEEGCLVKRPSYGYPGTRKGLYCSKHGKPKGMSDVKNKKCRCGKSLPSFGRPGEKRECCFECKEPGMENVVSKMCETCDTVRSTYGFEKGTPTHCQGCSKQGMTNVVSKMCEVCDIVQPTYGFEKGKATHCKECSKPGMKNVKDKICGVCNSVQPTYGFVKGKPTHCKKCSIPGMKNVKDKMCEACDQVRPTYGFEKGKATHCQGCSKLGMKNVYHKMCEVCNDVHPIYGFLKGKATHCQGCSKPEMKDVINRMCEACDGVRPNYGFEKGEATHCKGCSKPGMMNGISKMCELCDDVQATYGFIKGKATHCNKCSKPGMKNVKDRMCEVCDDVRPTYGFEKGKATHCNKCSKTGMKDVVNKMCEEFNCKSLANHGIPGNLKTLCTQHKKIGMIRNPRRKCRQPNCNEIALFGDTTHEFCESHSNPDMHNFIERECISCHLPEILNSQMKCINCDEVHFMGRRLLKQNKVRDMVLARNYKFDSCDKIIEGSCDRERPDFIFQKEKHIVIIEVDENQHGSYHNNVTFRGVPTDCETVRMINIVHSFGGLKVIFIRYNPDQFKVNGIKQEVTDLKRHDTLISYLKYYLEMDIPDDKDNWLQVKYLFYDDYDPSNTELIKIPIEYGNLNEEDFNEYNEFEGYEQDIDFEGEYDFKNEKNNEYDISNENSTLPKNIDDCSDGYSIDI